MEVERNHQSLWKRKWLKYWTLHWLQPVACKVFVWLCCFRSGNDAFCRPDHSTVTGGHPSPAPCSHHVRSAQFQCSCPALHPHRGGGNPALRWWSFFPGVRFDNYTWYSICCYQAVGSFLKLHVGDACVCALELSKYCKIKPITENDFWAEKGRCLAVPEEHYFRGYIYCHS